MSLNKLWEAIFDRSAFSSTDPKRKRPLVLKVNSRTTKQFSEDGRSRRLKEQAAKFCHDINKLRERTNNRQRDLDSVSHFFSLEALNMIIR